MADERTLPDGRRKDTTRWQTKWHTRWQEWTLPDGRDGHYPMAGMDTVCWTKTVCTIVGEGTSPSGRMKTLPDSGRERGTARCRRNNTVRWPVETLADSRKSALSIRREKRLQEKKGTRPGTCEVQLMAVET
jgi:hypothetical protein